MLSLTNILTTIQSQIGANALFSQWYTPLDDSTNSIFIDDGTKSAAIDSSKQNRGFAVVIAPILRAKKSDGGGAGRIVLTAEAMVWVVINPEINSAQTPPMVMPDMIKTVIESVLGYTPISANDRKFTMPDDALELHQHDAGVFQYNLFFTKIVTI